MTIPPALRPRAAEACPRPPPTLDPTASGVLPTSKMHPPEHMCGVKHTVVDTIQQRLAILCCAKASMCAATHIL